MVGVSNIDTFTV